MNRVQIKVQIVSTKKRLQKTLTAETEREAFMKFDEWFGREYPGESYHKPNFRTKPK